MNYTLTPRICSAEDLPPELADDCSDIEYRSKDEKYTVATEVHNWIVPLFVAAPKLLEACEAGRVYCEALKRAWAEGDPEDVGTGAIVRSATKELDVLLNNWLAKNNAAIAKAKP